MKYKKIIIILAVIVFFSKFSLASAEVSINEIMYDLDGADIDWVEIYNPDNTDVDLQTLKLFINNVGSNHSIEKYSGSQTLHQGEYGIIVPTASVSSFVSKWGSDGNLFTSSFSLSNANGTIEINNGDKFSVVSSVSYYSSQGASGSGDSLQFINGSWISATPTPGENNQAENASQSSNNNENTSNTKAEPETKSPTILSIKAKILTNTLAFAGQPFEIKTNVFGYSDENVLLGRASWNFGDGVSFEQINNFEKFLHTYYYPGEYVVFLDYFSFPSSKIPDASNKIIIKVVPATVSISKVGNEKDFFVELSNDTNYEIDLSNWILSSFNKNFILPKNTIILAKKKIILSSKITQFSIYDKNNLQLLNPQGEIVFNYSAPFAKIASAKTINKSVAQPEVSAIPFENLPASIASSEIMKDDGIRTYLLTTVFTIFLGLSAGVVYFIRQKKTVSNPGDDFKILDE